MVSSYIKINAALLVICLSTASTYILNEESNTRPLPANCAEAVCSAGAEAKSGIYQIRLPLDGWTHRPFYVYCLLDGNGGDPWLLVQRREDASIDFNRNWNDYKHGFGNLNTNFFIGLDKLHALTQVQLNELQIELHDFNDDVRYAHYDSFAVGDESQKYELNILGNYSGNAGDSLLGYHDGEKFSTYDQDNDNWSSNCAEKYKGGWWYNSCLFSNLNGEYLKGKQERYNVGIDWEKWHGNNYSLKYAHMEIRPRDSAAIRAQRC
ncbi:fibrinogen C domain-containing protein 1-like [Zeugodacus cucurbitae]|uniref:fibrinogen C domain-containing protein 1-like n=1 Tax=Zeugodacus cucurbitae TaxID=28588 RepID=UPI0023D91378|nr:fibrinogen C domain-containing protein 1-like [Zeugodacus cucurbitae]